MTEAAGPDYAGLPTAEAPPACSPTCARQGLLRGEEPYTHTVPFSHRSGARVEPLISLQWFCDMKALAEPAIGAVEDGRVSFHPRMPHTRSTWTGCATSAPGASAASSGGATGCPSGTGVTRPTSAETPPDGEGWERDPDVLDTWFSSALWPFATLGWPEETPELRAFYPTQVLSTAREIIFLWVARMVMMGVEFTGREPFADVYIHSVIQAPDGRRMSKSLGTGIDPLDVIAEHGADALRFGLLLMSSTQDVRYSEDRVRQGRQLVTKLWNATRLVVDRGGAAGVEAPPLELLADRWIASRTAAAVAEYERLLGGYEFSALADLVYHLIFDEYCDWYLELLKAGEATPEVAGAVLEQLLAMAHPLIPFVTEECLVAPAGRRGAHADAPPARAPGPVDPEAEARMAAVREDVTRVRAERAERGLPPRAPMVVRLPAARSGEAVAAVLALADPVTLGPPAEGAVAAVAPARGRPRGRAGPPARPAGRCRGRADARRGQAGQRPLRTAGAGRAGRGRAREGGPPRRRGRAPAGRPGRAGGRVTPGEARRWVEALEVFGMRFGLERMRALLDALGRPERSFAAIHIVGSNGKSSTARLAAAALAGEGRRAGTYLSPHVSGWRERIELGGRPIGPDRFAAVIGDVRAAAEALALAPEDRVTQFEALTAAAFLAFARARRRRRRGRGGPGRALRRDQRPARTPSSPSPTSPSSTPTSWARPRRPSPPRSSPWPRPARPVWWWDA